MASGKKHKHWSERVHESVVSRNKSGQLNLVIKGGAEELKFPSFGNVKQDRVIYHSGKIQEGDILLEVNDQSVVGLTLYDLNNLIKQARDPARFKTVKEGPTLNKDLKLYLSQRFNKDSVDHQLQAAIRDNLYLRTLPCTTRQLREGEIDGVDYTFLSVEQFQELEKSGALLESGIYEGNYYGTPKPPPVPLSSPMVRRSNSANDLLGMHPSSDGKRRRNRSNIEPQPTSNETEKKPLSVTTKTNSAGKEPPPVSAKLINPNQTTPKPNETSPQNSPVNELGSLPEGWELARTESGDFYFIDHIGKKTSWVDPRLEEAGRKKLEDCEDDELPHGWEKVEDPQYGVYYVDHVDKKTQFENPVLEAKKKTQNENLGSTENEQQPEEHIDEPGSPNEAPTNNVEEEEEFPFTNDPTKLKGTFNSVPIEKSSQGFGFTIVGGDDPDEFLQIKSVVPNGAAAQSGNIDQGDIIVNVNDTCVLGWTHPDVVKLFQAIPVGQIVTLQLCRGYPLMVDSQDPDTNILTTYAINPEDRPLEEFERQLRMLNNQLENNNGLDDSPSKSMPDISYNQNQFNMEKLSISQQNQYNMYIPRSGSMGALPAPVVMQVIIHKGDQGFGFTISDSPLGQRVKQILDAMRCRDLMEFDVLLEINGTAVQNMPHNNVVQILKECPRNAAAIFVIQRGPNPHYDPNTGAHMNGVVSQQHGAPGQQPYYRQRLKEIMMRSQTEPGLGSENGSVVSAPPSANMTVPANIIHPVNALMNEYRSKHAVQRQEQHAPPVSTNYQPYGGQNLYHNPYQPADNYIDLQVVLRREESGFGFRILGGNYQNESVTIGAIIPGGAADNEGTLRTGDELLTVDNQMVTRMGHNQVIGLMGNAARNAIVKLGIRRRVGATQIALQQQQQNKYNRAHNLSRPSSRGPVTSPSPLVQPFDIIIHRREHEGFGFVIISSVKTSGASILAPHKIGRIIDGSPAARCGHLRVGDRILAVNSHDITHLHHGQIVNLIKDSGFSIALRVLPLEVEEEEKHQQQQQDDYIAIELHRSKKGFGFGIRGGKEYEMPLYVLRIAHDGPAAQSGLVKVGDILVEINGHSTVDVPHSHAIDLIKQGGQRVKLLLQKGNGTVPDIETNSSGSVQSLTSSAISGPESAHRAAKSLQQQNGVQKLPPSPTKPLLPNLNPRQQVRRRANSSGEVLPSATQVAAQLRMRRAITPNPTLAPHPASSSDEDKPTIKNMKPCEDKGLVPLNGSEEVTSPTLTTDSAKTDENAETNGDVANSGVVDDFGGKKKKSSKKKLKGGKNDKGEKSKSTKVGLWLSPKNKGKEQKK